MRWSWNAFVAGGVVGAALTVLMLWTGPGEPGSEIRTVTDGAGEPSVESGRAAAPHRERRPRHPRTQAAPEDEGGDPAPGLGEEEWDETFTHVSSRDIPILGDLFGARVDLGGGVARTDIAAEWQIAKTAAVAQQDAAGDAAAVERLLDSGSGATLQAGIYLAAHHSPPMIDRLVEIARDPRYGFYRGLALVGLARHPADERAAETLLAHLRDDDPVVREASIRALPSLGARGVEAARRLLRDGDYAEEVTDALTTTVVLGGQGLDALRTGVPPDAAMALLLRFEADFKNLPDDERAALANQLAGIVRVLMDEPTVAAHVPEMFPLFVLLAKFDFLEELATSAHVPDTTRMAALYSTRSGDVEHAGQIVERILGDLSTPVPFLRDVIGRIDGDFGGAERFQALLLGLAANHPNPWVREDALHKLAWTGPSADGDLRIVSAVYGKHGKNIEVTIHLNEAIQHGRLRIAASNDIAGDPLVGTLKDLRVEYRYRGKLYVRTVREGQTLALP